MPEPPTLRPLQRKLFEAISSTSSAASSSGGELIPALTAFLGQAAAGGDGSGSISGAGAAKRLMQSWRAAASSLAAAPQRLPAPLQGMFEDLLEIGKGAGVGSGDGDVAAAVQQVEELQAKLAAFLEAWDGEVGGAGEAHAPALAATTEAEGVRRVGWLDAGGGGAVAGEGAAALRGLVELVGEEDALGMMAGGKGREKGARGERGGGDDPQPYQMLEEVQHDIHIQRYLTVRPF